MSARSDRCETELSDTMGPIRLSGELSTRFGRFGSPRQGHLCVIGQNTSGEVAGLRVGPLLLRLRGAEPSGQIGPLTESRGAVRLPARLEGPGSRDADRDFHDTYI